MITYRYGTEDDLEQIITNLAVPCAEIYLKMWGLTLDQDGIRDFLVTFCSNPNNRPLLAFDNDKLIGGLFLYINKPFFMKESFLSDHGLFVLPDYRGGIEQVGKKLTRWAIDIATNMGLRYSPMVSNGTQSAERMYEQLGGKRAGSLWMFGAK